MCFTRHTKREREKGGGAHRAQFLWLFEQRGAHAAREAERFRTPAIESDAGDVVLDDFHGLDCEFGRGAAELEDEARLFERVAIKDGAAVFQERDDAGAGCDPSWRQKEEGVAEDAEDVGTHG